MKLPALLHAAKHLSGLVDLVNNNKNNTTPGSVGGIISHPSGLLPTPSALGNIVIMTRTPFYHQPSQVEQQQQHQAFQPDKSSDSPLNRSLSAGGKGAIINKRKNKAPERVPTAQQQQLGKTHGGTFPESEEQSINKDMLLLQGFTLPIHPPSSMNHTDKPKMLKWNPLKKSGDATLTNTTTTTTTTTVSNPDAQKKRNKNQKNVAAIAEEECVERQRKLSDSDNDDDNNNNNNDEAYRGVYHTGDGIYKVRLSINSRKKVIGFYRSAKEGALAYDYAARHHHGNKAVLNFPRLNANPRAISQEALLKVKKKRQDVRLMKMQEREGKRIRKSNDGDGGHRSRGRPINREKKKEEEEEEKKRKKKKEESEESDGDDGNNEDLPGAKRRRSMMRGPDLVGKRIRIFWPAESRWFSGYVTQYRSDPPSSFSSKHHFITYDDGDKDWVDLTSEKYRLVLTREEQEKQDMQQLKKKKIKQGEDGRKQKEKEQMKERERRARDRLRKDKRGGGRSSRRDRSIKITNNKRSPSTNGGYDQYKKNKNGNIITNSKYLGVTLYHGSRGWRSRICYNNQISELGVFETEVAAAKAYDAMARKLMGVDAWKKVNFPTAAEEKKRNR